MAVADKGRPLVLVIERDVSVRRLAAIELELHGAEVVGAESLERARLALESTPRLAAAVVGEIDGVEPEAICELIRQLSPGVPITELGGHPDGQTALGHEIQALSETLDLGHAPQDGLAASGLLAAEVDEVSDAWRELCRWDPMLPPDAEPPVAGAVIAAVASALDRPQPIGWGPDPQVEAAVEIFADRVGSAETVVAELVCLREALRRWLMSRVPVNELSETVARLDMIADRAIQVAVAHAIAVLQRDALTDPLTGLLNRRALERDMRRELARASRYGRKLTVLVADLDGLKQINDRHGHTAGDEQLRRLAQAFDQGLRMGDTAYRVGGDEFVALLPEAGESRANPVASRLADLGAPAFSWGAATFPDDGGGLEELIEQADARLYESRRAARA